MLKSYQLKKKYYRLKNGEFVDLQEQNLEMLAELMKTLQLSPKEFGGILADDMGLGKTLQVISVLLAAKEEKQSGTWLVVAPAALVYNWGEELEWFAPSLNVVLVMGNQAERQKKLRENFRKNLKKL